MKRTLAVVSLVVSGYLLCLGVALLGSLAFILLLSVLILMNPNPCFAGTANWGLLTWVLGLSLLGFVSSWLALIVGMRLWRSAVK